MERCKILAIKSTLQIKKMLREISQEVFHDPRDVNFIFLFLLIYFFFIFEIPRWGLFESLIEQWQIYGGAWLPLILGKKEKGLQTEKSWQGKEQNTTPPLPLRTEFPVFWEFLIPKNSQKFPIMQIIPANWIPSFLGIPRNSQGWCINHSWWYLDFWRGVCSGRSTDRSWQQFPLLNAEVPGAEH